MGLFYTMTETQRLKLKNVREPGCKQGTGVSLSVCQDLFYIKQLIELQSSPVM